MRFFGIIGVLLLGVWYLPAMLWGFQITTAMQKFQNGDMGALASIAEGPAPIAWLRNRNDVAATFSEDDLNSQRYVQLQLILTPEDLLAEGEAAPEEAFRDLYAEARAPAILHEHCAEFLGTLALRCDVLNTNGSWKTPRREGEEESIEVSGWLLYTPAYDMGDPSSVSNGDVISARAPLSGREETLENTPEGRAIGVTRALAVCDGLRAIYGNCVASSITMVTDSWTGGMRVIGGYDVYADKTSQTRETVQAALDKTVAELLPDIQ